MDRGELNLRRVDMGVVPVERIIGLRHRVLRAGLPVETARFDGDGDEHSLHFALFIADDQDRITEPSCCVSLMLKEYGDKPAWQLRGMATDPSLQGNGLGGALLQFAEEQIAIVPELADVRLLWCNARSPAVGFYKKNGWQVDSDEFEILTAGPHFKMVKNLR